MVRSAAIAVAAGLLLGCPAPAPNAATAAAPDLLSRFDREVDVLRHWQDRLVAAGFPDAREVTVEVDVDTLLPYYAWGEVSLNPFLDAAVVEAQLGAIVDGVYGPRAAVFWAAFPDRAAAVRSFQEFSALAVAHELVHHLRSKRLLIGAWDPLDEELRAVELEYALLGELIADGEVPADWLPRWVALQRAILGACEPAVVAALPPAGSPEVRAGFTTWRDAALAAAAAAYAGQPRAPSADPQRWVAVYTRHRVAQAEAGPPRRFAEMARERLADPVSALLYGAPEGPR